MSDRVADLHVFASGLDAELDRRLKNLIKEAADIHSARTDLRIAAGFAARSIDMEGSKALPEDWVEDCRMALLYSAIVYYGRATKSTSDHRKTFDLRRWFDENERASHDRICALRDDAIAHYGPGELPDGAMLREDKIYHSELTDTLLYTSRSISGSQSLAHLVRKQAQRALHLTQRLHELREAQLIEQLRKVRVEDRAKEPWSRSITTLADGMGDSDAAAAVLSGPLTGVRRLTGTTKGNSDENGESHFS